MNVYILYILLGLGLVTFYFAVKPTQGIRKLKNLFWIMGNLFVIAGLFYKYYYAEEPEYIGLILLLLANWELVRQKRKGTIE